MADSRKDNEFGFLDNMFKNVLKASIVIGLVASYYKDDTMLMFLLIVISIVVFGNLKNGGVNNGNR